MFRGWQGWRGPQQNSGRNEEPELPRAAAPPHPPSPSVLDSHPVARWGHACMSRHKTVSTTRVPILGMSLHASCSEPG